MPYPIYDLTGKKVFCFSDEEGGAPFVFPQEANTNSRNQVLSELNEAFTFDDGLITSMRNGIALGFLGDLIDNQNHSIRAMLSMIHLKEQSPDSVILIAGNRDFNKIRYGVELYFSVVTATGNELPWEGTNSFTELYTRLQGATVQFRQTEIPTYMKNSVAPWNANIAKPNGKIVPSFAGNDCKLRVETIMGPTMATGTPGVMSGPVAIASELETMIPEMAGKLVNGSALMDETAAKFLCVLQMVMALPWGNAVPPYLKDFVGVYAKYLEVAHIGALFTIGEKTGYMSHAGFPYAEANGNLTRGLSSPLGLPYKNASLSPTTLTDIVLKNEQEKEELLQAVASLMTSPYSSDVYSIIDKFVHLTAGTKEFAYSSPEDKYQPYKFSPIVDYGRPINAIKNIRVKVRGGNWIEKNRSRTNKFRLAYNATNTLDYNIFGHQPQGFLPTAYRAGTTLHVCLDISKLETGGTNNYSFAFLVLDAEGGERFMGRIRFPDTPATVYNSNTSELKNQTIYYNEVITGNELKTRVLPGTSYAIQYTPKPPPIFEERAIRKVTSGGKRSVGKHRKTRRTHKVRKTRKHIH